MDYYVIDVKDIWIKKYDASLSALRSWIPRFANCKLLQYQRKRNIFADKITDKVNEFKHIVDYKSNKLFINKWLMVSKAFTGVCNYILS